MTGQHTSLARGKQILKQDPRSNTIVVGTVSQGPLPWTRGCGRFNLHLNVVVADRAGVGCRSRESARRASTQKQPGPMRPGCFAYLCWLGKPLAVPIEIFDSRHLAARADEGRGRELPILHQTIQVLSAVARQPKPLFEVIQRPRWVGYDFRQFLFTPD